jgi:hypothetical protein
LFHLETDSKGVTSQSAPNILHRQLEPSPQSYQGCLQSLNIAVFKRIETFCKETVVR